MESAEKLAPLLRVTAYVCAKDVLYEIEDSTNPSRTKRKDTEYSQQLELPRGIRGQFRLVGVPVKRSFQ